MEEVSTGVLVQQGDWVVYLDVEVIQHAHEFLLLGGYDTAYERVNTSMHNIIAHDYKYVQQLLYTYTKFVYIKLM